MEKKSFLKVVEELLEKDIECFILDKKGESIRKAKIPKDCAFILGDHEGLPKQEMKRLKKSFNTNFNRSKNVFCFPNSSSC